MDAMKKRVRAFTEGVVVMVCPVLLALSLKKVDMKSKGDGPLRGTISLLAAFTLEAGLLPFLCLCLSKLLADRFASRLFRATKLLVHISALLLMALACGILLLISMRTAHWLLVLVPLALMPFTLWSCYTSTRNDHDQDARMYQGCESKLETSVDFSAAVTALLFLGLEGLALEGQSSSTGVQGPEHLLGALWLSFVTCVVGVFIMLVTTVPPLNANHDDRADMCKIVEALNIVLAVAFTAIVFLITFAPLEEVAWNVFVPSLVSFIVWIYRVLGSEGDGGQQALDEDVKPASLELTKVTFTGFLALSLPTFSNNNSNHAFTFLTASAVITGLGWRLLTHRTPVPHPMVKAANVASFSAHMCVAASVIPFAIMASKALK